MHNKKTRPRNMGPERGTSEKPKDLKNAIKSMIRYLDKYLPFVIVAFLLAALSSVLSIIGPNKLSDLTDVITDGLLTGIDFDMVKSIGLFLLIIYLLSALFNYVQNFIMVTVSNNFAKDLRSKILTKINKLPLKYFDNHSYGDVLSRVTNDVDTINFSMHQSLGTLVAAITLFIGSIIMMFVTNWILAITAIASSLIGFSFMFLILSKSQKYFDQRQVGLGDLNGHIEEIYSSHNVVKAYNGNKDASNKFDVLNNNVFTCDRMSQFLSGLMQPIMSFIGNFGYVCVCVVGAILTMNGYISFGVIVAFMIYVRLFTGPLSQIAQGMTSLQSTAAASERVFEFLEEDEMADESMLTKKLNPKKVKGKIEFEHVKFGYNPDKTIIKDFNCKVKPGEKIAIVGPTGAGKTTMVNLLMKFYNITDGDIKIDGVSVKDLTRENIHDLFIMVLQDTWLFNGTIRDNIKYNKKKVSDEKIMEALKTVGVDHFVKSLPGVLDYEITDNDSVSQGQKQLLTIARGMIKDAPFLILDEATSSVDTRTEELVQKAMDKLTEGRTSFIIAHRLSTIKNADLILVMNGGNIIEQGNHDELMKQNGFYAELYNSQFRK
jgi:ATP-binding cassette subfamily B multidrug efflux pump